MRTVGETLRKTRQEKNLSFEDVEKFLRIRKKFLLALEENNWEKLPSPPYIKGFIRNYSNYLGLDSEEMVAIFRRQFLSKEKDKLLPENITDMVKKPILRITPQNIVVSFLALFVGLLMLYLLFQYQVSNSPPYLEIVKPLEGEIVAEDILVVSGKTDRDAVVSVNNEKTVIGEDGMFSKEIALTPGTNTIIIESTSKNGKKRTVSRTVQLPLSQ